jgi:hypothetical protein
MLGSLIGTVRRARPDSEPLSLAVVAGERWLLLGEGLGELASRLLETSDVEVVVISPRVCDFKPLQEYKLSPERDRLTFLCSTQTDPLLIESQSFDGVATKRFETDFRRFLRPGGRVVRLSS